MAMIGFIHSVFARRAVQPKTNHQDPKTAARIRIELYINTGQVHLLTTSRKSWPVNMRGLNLSWERFL